jgi:hypothetical protein
VHRSGRHASNIMLCNFNNVKSGNGGNYLEEVELVC